MNKHDQKRRLTPRLSAISAACILALMAAPAALATSAVDFRVTGSLTALTCNIGSTVLLDIGRIPVSSIKPNTGTAWAYGTITSNGCTGVTSVAMTFTGDVPVEPAHARLFQAKGVTGVAVAVDTTTGSGWFNVAPGATHHYAPLGAGDGWPIRARLWPTGSPLTPGLATANITVIVEYT